MPGNKTQMFIAKSPEDFFNTSKHRVLTAAESLPEILSVMRKQDKSFRISQNGLTRSWEKICEEVDKCILVCANCYRELHAKKRSLPQKCESEK